MSNAWVPDILGKGFEQLTLALGEDDEGEVTATLVRSIPNQISRATGPLADVDVLYVHGWSDFFFQTELARFWNRLGARFYALDLRKYGRSLRAGQTPGHAESLEVYDEDIAAAREAMARGRDAASRRLVLLGHSTGGLTLSLWAARHPRAASAIVLNSPWLELQLGPIGRQALAPLIGVQARIDPRRTNPAVDLGFYTRAQSELGSLPDGLDLSVWRPERGFATHPGWLYAVIQGHRTIAAGVDVGAPTLVLLSSRWASPFAWSDALTSSDSVLVVDDIARAATRIGSLVTIGRIDGAIHDVFLSAADARARAYEVLERWIIGSLDPRHPILFGPSGPRS